MSFCFFKVPVQKKWQLLLFFDGKTPVPGRNAPASPDFGETGAFILLKSR